MNRRRFHVVLLAVGLSVLASACQQQPLTLLDQAQKALARAKLAGAPVLAADRFREAERALSFGSTLLSLQNQKLAPFRDYGGAEVQFFSAISSANAATVQTRDHIRQQRNTTQSEIDALRYDIEAWRADLENMLSGYTLEKHWKKAELACSTAENLFENGAYKEARESAQQGRDFLRRMGDVHSRLKKGQTELIRAGEARIRETVEASRRDRTAAVIVDKTRHKAYLLKNGTLLHSYNCELGYNSGRQKMSAGDGATPEGKYKVVSINRGSRYYKALLLNYPNEDDKKRFRDNKADGTISKRAGIGSLIEIHGAGGRGTDWTEGCVALTNDNMDRVLEHVRVGTPVTIVRRSDAWP